MWWIVLGALIWAGCSALTYAMMFAMFQGRWPCIAAENYRSDMAFAAFMGIFWGPLGLVMSFFMTGFAEHGLKWR